VFLVEFEFGWAIRVPTLRGFGAGLGLVWLCVFVCPWIRCLWKNMEEVTEGVANLNVQDDTHKKNRIQVSNTKKPLFFYVNLAKVNHHTSLRHYSFSFPLTQQHDFYLVGSWLFFIHQHLLPCWASFQGMPGGCSVEV
jgi:hypothetical protein